MSTTTLPADRRAAIDAISRTPIPTLPVTSTQIAEVGYESSTNTLAVRFKPRAGEAVGSLYHYGNVKPAMYDAFIGAESVGSFFHNNIKPNSLDYPYVRIEEAKKEDADDQQAA
jgi:hypothetical protein